MCVLVSTIWICIDLFRIFYSLSKLNVDSLDRFCLYSASFGFWTLGCGCVNVHFFWVKVRNIIQFINLYFFFFTIRFVLICCVALHVSRMSHSVDAMNFHSVSPLKNTCCFIRLATCTIAAVRTAYRLGFDWNEFDQVFVETIPWH